jgi:hypothetical protein
MANKAAWSGEGFTPPAPEAERYPYADLPDPGEIVLIQIDTDGPHLPAIIQTVESIEDRQPMVRLMIFSLTGVELPAMPVAYGHKRGFWHWTEKEERTRQ